MERESVMVKEGREYDHLFPRAKMTETTEKKGATVTDTLKFIPKVVRETAWQTREIAKVLKGKTIYETCENIWNFVFDHIAYKKDENSKEQIRTPARAWADRHSFKRDQKTGKYILDKEGNKIPGGCDCDCYSVLIAGILRSLNIKCVLRTTAYSGPHYQHIYPIVPLSNGSHITIDCVVKFFDYEEPYSKKLDTPMDLEYLNGIENSGASRDQLDLIGYYDDKQGLEELGALFKNNPLTQIKNAVQNVTNTVKTATQNVTSTVKTAAQNAGSAIKTAAQNAGSSIKNVVHTVNKLNPVTAILRGGILAAMKLNVLKVAQRLKWGYLTDEDAKRRGVDMAKFMHLKGVRVKIENIFHGAGGNIANLREAIMTGKGNANRELSGLGCPDKNIQGMCEYTPMRDLLGHDMYEDEFNGLGELGEPVTAATIATASGVIAAIAGLLKSIGSIFPKKDKASADFDNAENVTVTEGGAQNELDAGQSELQNMSPIIETLAPVNNDMELKNGNITPTDTSALYTSGANENLPATGNNGDTNANAKNTSEETFWTKNKKWIIPTSIGIGVLGLGFAGYKIATRNKDKTKEEKPAADAVNGLEGVKKPRRRKNQKRETPKSKQPAKKKGAAKTPAIVHQKVQEVVV